MKLARYRADGSIELGLVADGVHSITRHIPDAPISPNEMIARWDEFSVQLSSLIKQSPDFSVEDVKLLAPVPDPRKIFGIGLNYADHIAESGMEAPTDQLYFSMSPTSANGPFDTIALPKVSQQLDYEAELVIVIGKKCRYASKNEAADAIFGYCAGNDVSVRDWQFRTSQFILGKSFDTHAPHGPVIVTADAINANSLDIKLHVNGDLRQSSNTKHLIFSPADMVSHLSQVVTLEPGDLIFTGTPDGVGAVMDPPKWLREGDVVRVEIEDIGWIENIVKAD